MSTPLASRRILIVAAAILILGPGPRASAQAVEDMPPPVVQAAAPLKISAYSQVQFVRSGGATAAISVPKVRITLDSQITRLFRLKTTVDAVKSPILLDANMDVALFAGGLIRLGQFKVPFSQENLTSASDHDLINLPRSVASLAPGRDIGASGRDIGACVQYRAGSFEVTAGLFNGAGINKTDTNRQKDLAGRILYSPLQSFTLGGSLYQGRYSAAADQPAARRDRAGLEAAFTLPLLSLKAEFILARDGAVSKRGGYAQLGVFLIPKTWQLVARYDGFDSRDASAPGRDDTWTVGINRFFALKTKFQVNLEWKGDRQSGRGTAFSVLALFQAGF